MFSKGVRKRTLVRAVRDAAVGKPLPQARRSPRLPSTPTSSRRKSGPFDAHETLTAREREVLQLAAEGKTNSKIAECLHISHRTVDNHRAHLMQKLGLQNQTELDSLRLATRIASDRRISSNEDREIPDRFLSSPTDSFPRFRGLGFTKSSSIGVSARAFASCWR